MNPALQANSLGDNPNTEPTQQPSALATQSTIKPPRRPLGILILIVLALIALGLMILPRPSLYYPNIVVDAVDSMQLDFLLSGRQDKAACEAANAEIANALVTSCRECRIRSQTCIKNLPSELRQRFDETPLAVPSARMANGIIIFSAPLVAGVPDLALLACQESERQAVLKGDKVKVACYPAGAPRPHTVFENYKDQTGHTIFSLLLAIGGALITSLVTAIFIAHRQQVARSLQDSVLTTRPFAQKFILAGVDTLILLGTFLALAWPSSDDVNRWSRLDRNTVIGHGLVIILTIGWFWLLLEHYARRRPFWDELREIFRVLAVMFMVSGAAAFVAGLETGRASHLLVWVLNFLLIPLGRVGARQLQY